MNRIISLFPPNPCHQSSDNSFSSRQQVSLGSRMDVCCVDGVLVGKLLKLLLGELLGDIWEWGSGRVQRRRERGGRGY